MVRRGLALACAIVAACSFDPGSFTSLGDDGAPGPDGAQNGPDAPPGTPDSAPPPDSRPVDASLPDAGVDLGPFGTAGLALGINTFDNEDDPTLRGDMLEMYFNSDRPGGQGSGDLWRATRTSVLDAWSGVENVVGLNSASNETTPDLTPDGLTIYFASDRVGTAGGTDIYRATRGSVAQSFSLPMRVVELCSTGNDFSAHEQPGGVLLYLGSNRGGGVGSLDVYRTFRLVTGLPWSTPALILDLATTSVDADTWIDATDVIVVFDSDRPGGMGGRDLWTGARGSGFTPFESFAPVSELNTATQDMDPWLAPDMRTIFFASDRLGDEDIFVADR